MTSDAGRRAVVLAGGLGMRLRPYTTVLPKPLMPIGDRPVLDVVVRQLRRHGFAHVTIATGHLAELIEAFFGDGASYGVRIDYFRESKPLGTVGALAHIRELADHFMVMNGDVLTDIDYGALMDRHAAGGADVTVAVKRRTVQISLGVLNLADAGNDLQRVVGFEEKPTLNYDASMGVYCFAPSALEFIDADERLDFPDLILRLLAAGRTVHGWRSPDYWLDIGRHDDYEQALEEFERLKHRLLPED